MNKDDRSILQELQTSGGNVRLASRNTGFSRNKCNRVKRDYYNHTDSFSVVGGHDANVRPLDDILSEKKKIYNSKLRDFQANKLINIKLNDNLPIGIAHMGDLHIDDNGCAIHLLESHVKIIKSTKGMFAGNIGDYTNNWVGNLSHKYSKQNTTTRDGWELVKWYFKSCTFMYAINGNHDYWWSDNDSDPIKYLANHNGILHKNHGMRLSVDFKNKRSCRINARHHFKGSSKINTVQGAMSKAKNTAQPDHIYVSGHTHTVGYGWVPHVDHPLSHCIKPNSYKHFDEYSDKEDFDKLWFSPCITTIIDPCSRNDAGFVQVFACPFLAADYLTFLRKRRKK